ncbi:kinase-like domain-containing protein [Xylariaceae sp. FL1019]|nr:kinase-like domain-containing protein [Xylariaceae sp. FL1019]
MDYKKLPPGARFNFAGRDLICKRRLGSGGYGVVYKVQEVNRPEKFYALKTPKPRPKDKNEAWRWDNNLEYARREVDFLQEHSHPHIINILSNLEKEDVRFLMPLCPMSLLQFVTEHQAKWSGYQDEQVFHQMLMALDYMAAGNPKKVYIHRDLKPENILLAEGSTIDNPQFLLADFGICRLDTRATTQIGTFWYTAPEIAIRSRHSQTPKVDIYSLFVTLQWCHSKAFQLLMADSRGLHQEDWYEAVVEYLDLFSDDDDYLRSLRSMSIWNPVLRPSAAQLLVQFFEGEGMTTPSSEVEPFNPSDYDLWFQLYKDGKNALEDSLDSVSPVTEALDQMTFDRNRNDRPLRNRRQPNRPEYVSGSAYTTVAKSPPLGSNQLPSGSIYAPTTKIYESPSQEAGRELKNGSRNVRDVLYSISRFQKRLRDNDLDTQKATDDIRHKRRRYDS